MHRSFVVECFWPDVHREQVDEAAVRLRVMGNGDESVVFTGTIFVPGDEVIFYLFDSVSDGAVRELCARAAVPFERVVESITSRTS